jgi:hypothetical protein
MCQGKTDKHQIEARFRQTGVEMSDRGSERGNVFGQQMIGILDSPVQVGDFVVGLVGEVLFVGMIDEPRSAKQNFDLIRGRLLFPDQCVKI